MGIGMMARFAWFPCTWIGELGALMKAMVEFLRPYMVQGDGLWVDGRRGEG